jgi:hypothetical protein
VIIDGVVEEVLDPEEKEFALRQITIQYGEFKGEFSAEKITAARVWRVQPTANSLKQSP